jgi:hypothetical protein
MADESITDSAACCLKSPTAQEAKDQRVVLSFLLDEHPAQLTIPEVARALYANPGDFKENDAVERAIRDLVGGGLLLERGARVPRIDTLIKIATGLGIRIDCALLDGIAWTPGTSQVGGFKVEEEESEAVRLVRESREELVQRGERRKVDEN